MAILGEITVNQISLLEIDVDPRVTPTVAPIGSIATNMNNGYQYTKTSAPSTGWEFLGPRTITDVVSTGNATTTSGTYVLMTGTNVTPPAGDYLFTFTTYASLSTNNTTGQAALFIGGVEQTQTLMLTGRGNGTVFTPLVFTNYRATVNGSQAVEVRWFRSAGTFTSLNYRRLTYQRVG